MYQSVWWHTPLAVQQARVTHSRHGGFRAEPKPIPEGVVEKSRPRSGTTPCPPHEEAFTSGRRNLGMVSFASRGGGDHVDLGRARVDDSWSRGYGRRRSQRVLVEELHAELALCSTCAHRYGGCLDDAEGAWAFCDVEGEGFVSTTQAERSSRRALHGSALGPLHGEVRFGGVASGLPSGPRQSQCSCAPGIRRASALGWYWSIFEGSIRNDVNTHGRPRRSVSGALIAAGLQLRQPSDKLDFYQTYQ